jgi:hypothetical protein
MKNKLNIFLVLLVSVLVFSCDTDGYENYDAGGTNVEEVSGEWYAQLLVDGEVIVDYGLISTYNTAANNGDEMWVDDHQNLWSFKAKTPVNVEAKTFSGANLASNVDGYEITVTISNGKIIEDGGTTTEGAVADSISFDVEFSDDPGTVYTVQGYRKTGFLEGEH